MSTHVLAHARGPHYIDTVQGPTPKSGVGWFSEKQNLEKESICKHGGGNIY